MKVKISKRLLIIIISLLITVCAATGGTVAYLMAQTPEVENSFDPVFVSCQVSESFDGITKTDVKVTNTGDITAYIRATFIPMWKADNGAVHSSTPVQDSNFQLTLGSDKWVKGSDGYYYYTVPVLAGASTDVLFAEITPIGDSPDGYSLSVHIAATAIQAMPAEAVNQAWGATVRSDGSLIVP